MPLKLPDSDNDYLPVTVPRSDKPVVPVSPERVERLRQHLLETLRDLRKARRIDRLVSSVSPEPDGFRSVVARTACSLCRGSCCRHGGDEAFLDERTLARFRVAKPEITDQAITRLYLDRVPEVVQGESCIFHGKRGLHAGSVDARGCLQSFLLRRALSLYPKQCCPRTDRHFRWRRRKDADLIGSSASIRRWRTNNGPSLGEVSCTPEIVIAAALALHGKHLHGD